MVPTSSLSTSSNLESCIPGTHKVRDAALASFSVRKPGLPQGKMLDAHDAAMLRRQHDALDFPKGICW
eukprot:4685359-Alexandrium_andersonii.AAC.1